MPSNRKYKGKYDFWLIDENIDEYRSWIWIKLILNFLDLLKKLRHLFFSHLYFMFWINSTIWTLKFYLKMKVSCIIIIHQIFWQIIIWFFDLLHQQIDYFRQEDRTTGQVFSISHPNWSRTIRFQPTIYSPYCYYYYLMDPEEERSTFVDE